MSDADLLEKLTIRCCDNLTLLFLLSQRDYRATTLLFGFSVNPIRLINRDYLLTNRAAHLPALSLVITIQPHRG